MSHPTRETVERKFSSTKQLVEGLSQACDILLLIVALIISLLDFAIHILTSCYKLVTSLLQAGHKHATSLAS